MTLVNLTRQPLAYLKGYAEALSEVKYRDADELTIYDALTKCLDKHYDTSSMLPHAADLPTKEHDLGRTQAFSECAEAYRQLGEVKGWEHPPILSDFISWRHALAQGLIDKQQQQQESLMTKEEFDNLVTSIENNDYSPNLMGECLAYALLQGEWEFQHIGSSCVVLATNAGKQAVVKAQSIGKMPGYYVYLLTGDTVKVLEAAESLNEVMSFLNQEPK